jgi:peptidoglycan/xylan/chitin deacetylase (PgdA/CDA1 family)
MTWAQVTEAVSTGLITIGSHTHTHADLDRGTRAQMEDELRTSKQLIEDNLGIACDDFAYPHAVVSAQADQLVREHYKTAAVGGWRKNLSKTLDPYAILRIPITRLDGRVFFRAKLKGRMGAEAALYRVTQRRG